MIKCLDPGQIHDTFPRVHTRLLSQNAVLGKHIYQSCKEQQNVCVLKLHLDYHVHILILLTIYDKTSKNYFSKHIGNDIVNSL